MLNTNNAMPGRAIRSRTAFALIAATLLVGGCITEASAKSKHRYQAKHSHQAKSNWQDIDRPADFRAQLRGKGLLLRQ
jgi:rare lipoprotein A